MRVHITVPRVVSVAVVAAGLLAGTAGTVAAAEPSVTRLYLTTDRAHIVELPEAVSKVSVTAPKVADVHVLSPTRMLLEARGVGATSLVVFSGQRARFYEVVVTPPPLAGPDVSGTEPHAVVVQRGGRMSNQIFRRNGDAVWVELGGPRSTSDRREPAARR